jgi:hypothetical protein
MGHELISTVGLAHEPGRASAIRRAAGAGELVRIRRGSFVESGDWASMSGRDRHRLLVRSVFSSTTSPGQVVVSHRSAVAVHGLPWIGEYGERVTVTDPSRDRGQVKRSIRRIGSAGRRPVTTEVDGVPVTTVVETAVDIALTEHPWRAVVVLDAVLRRGVPRAAILDALGRRDARGHRRARELVEHADALAESPGESITRWGAHVLGAPDPILQHEFRYDGPLCDRVDLWFEDCGVIVEFDGRVKYADPRGGRTAHDALVDEKRREDRLRRRREVNGLARVMWSDAMPAGQLPRILHDAGVPLGPNWGTAWRHAASRAL